MSLVAEAIAQADADLSSAGLPTYSELLVALRDCWSPCATATRCSTSPMCGTRTRSALGTKMP